MRGLALVALAGLTACNSEPSFDERYTEASQTITAKANEIDEKLANKPVSDAAAGESVDGNDRQSEE